MRVTLLAGALLWICCVGSGAQGTAPLRELVTKYRASILLAQREPSRGHLEAAFDSIGPLREALVGGQAQTRLEALEFDDFEALREELVGLHVNREEVVLVEPDVPFFGRLAARGDSADRAFFKALSLTYPDSVWPTYIEQQTDVTGCTRFGSGTLVSTYAAWSTFRRQHPGRYRQAAEAQLKKVVQVATESTCPCGAIASVEQELTALLRQMAVGGARTRVGARLRAVQGGSAGIRESCDSGR